MTLLSFSFLDVFLSRCSARARFFVRARLPLTFISFCFPDCEGAKAPIVQSDSRGLGRAVALPIHSIFCLFLDLFAPLLGGLSGGQHSDSTCGNCAD